MALARAVGGRRLRRIRPLHPGDVVVNWGERLVPRQWGVRVLNGEVAPSKIEELMILQAGGVPTPGASLLPRDGWIGRRAHHQGGRDFLEPTGNPAYWVELVETLREFRIHIFQGRSVRAGVRRQRGEGAHPWVRSYDAGWGLDYGTACQAVLTPEVREAARGAVEVLGYDFGAVDVGVCLDGSPIVFEVNSSPALEGRTLEVYAEKILRFYEQDGEGQTEEAVGA